MRTHDALTQAAPAGPAGPADVAIVITMPRQTHQLMRKGSKKKTCPQVRRLRPHYQIALQRYAPRSSRSSLLAPPHSHEVHAGGGGGGACSVHETVLPCERAAPPEAPMPAAQAKGSAAIATGGGGTLAAQSCCRPWPKRSVPGRSPVRNRPLLRLLCTTESLRPGSARARLFEALPFHNYSGPCGTSPPPGGTNATGTSTSNSTRGDFTRQYRFLGDTLIQVPASGLSLRLRYLLVHTAILARISL